MESPDTRHWQDEHDDLDTSRYSHDSGNERARYDSDGLTDFDADIIATIEKPDYGWKASLLHEPPERQFSTATAIHLDGDGDEDEDPFADEDEEIQELGMHKGVDEDVFVDENDPPQHEGRWRQTSSTQTSSTMPEESNLVHSSPYRSSAAIRSHSTIINTPDTERSRRAFPNRFISSPAQPNSSSRTYSSTKGTPAGDRYTSSPLVQRHQHHPSGFRNASSIRAMQMSSPSPPPERSPLFAQSPRSARQRRLDRLHDRSRSGTPSSQNQHPNPKKEYPLILLHCSFTAMIPAYPSSVLTAALPAWIQENLTLLHEKLNPMVVERGLLIPHPGEDYELLEERILENLELKRPRVGKCGHFLGLDALPEDGQNGGDSIMEAEKTGHEHYFRDDKCITCTRSIASTYSGTQGDRPHNRFDISIFAANGLMRAGAWSAAWREMEKVDVEIGVWMPEEVRAELEMEALKQATEHPGMFANEGDFDYSDDQTPNRGRRDFTYPQAPSPPSATLLRQRQGPEQSQRPRGDTLGSASGPASTAAFSKIRSTSAGIPRERHHSRDQATVGDVSNQAPLTELIANYAKRTFHPTKELLLQVFVALLALLVLRQQWVGSGVSKTSIDELTRPAETGTARSATNSLQDLTSKIGAAAAHITQRETAPGATSDISNEGGIPQALSPSAAAMATETLTHTLTVTAWEQPTAACTFAPEYADELGMTALPSAIARTVLEALSCTGAAAIPTSSMESEGADGEVTTAAADLQDPAVVED